MHSLTPCMAFIRHGCIRLRSIRCYLGREVTARLVCALIISQLDYCNAILANLPASTLAPPQRVLNAVMNLGSCDAIPVQAPLAADPVTDPIQTLHPRPSCNRRSINTLYRGAGDPCRCYPGPCLTALG